jgi:hypothetical protein
MHYRLPNAGYGRDSSSWITVISDEIALPSDRSTSVRAYCPSDRRRLIFDEQRQVYWCPDCGYSYPYESNSEAAAAAASKKNKGDNNNNKDSSDLKAISNAGRPKAEPVLEPVPRDLRGLPGVYESARPQLSAEERRREEQGITQWKEFTWSGTKGTFSSKDAKEAIQREKRANLQRKLRGEYYMRRRSEQQQSENDGSDDDYNGGGQQVL